MIESEVTMRTWLFGGMILIVGVSMGTRIEAQHTVAKHESPFACDRLALDPAARTRHFDVLGPALARARQRVHELPNGYEFEYPPDRATVQQVMEWAAGERLCCPFFDIEVRMEREGGSVWLRLTGREGTKQFIRSDFTRWMRS
jgi:hypothetical protein